MNNKELAIGEFYGKHHGIFNYRSRDARNEMKKYISTLNLPKDAIFCEAGGSGCRAFAMAKLGYKSYHIDISIENINHHNHQNLTSIHGSILDTHNIRDCYFICFLGIIQHTEYPAKALYNISKWMKLGGYLYFNYYNMDDLSSYWIEKIREIIKLANLSYDDCYKKFRNINIEHLFVPIINYGNYKIVLHDIELLGLSIIKKYSPNKFIVQKIKESNVELSELHYLPNLKPILNQENARKVLEDIMLTYFTPKIGTTKKVIEKIKRFKIRR